MYTDYFQKNLWEYSFVYLYKPKNSAARIFCVFYDVIMKTIVFRKKKLSHKQLLPHNKTKQKNGQKI